MKERERTWASFVTRVMICATIGALLVSATPYSAWMSAGTPPSTAGRSYPPTAPAVGPDSGDNPTDTIIYTLFSDPMAQNSVESAFTIEPTVTGTFNWTDDGQMIFEPDTLLTENTTYTARLNSSVACSSYANYLDGNSNGISEGSPIDDVVWNFTTRPPNEPPDPPPQDPQPWGQFLKTHEKTGHYWGNVEFKAGHYFGSTAARVDSTPVVGSGIVVFGDNEGGIYGLNEGDLSPAWSLKKKEKSRIRTMALYEEEDPEYFYFATEGGPSGGVKPKLQMRYLSNGEKVKGPIAGSLQFRGKNARIYSPLTFAPGATGENAMVKNDRIYVLVSDVEQGNEKVHLYGYSTSLKRELEYTFEGTVQNSGIAVVASASNPDVRRLVFGTAPFEGKVYSVPEYFTDPSEVKSQLVRGTDVYTTPSASGTDVFVTSFARDGNDCYLSKGPADMDSSWYWEKSVIYPDDTPDISCYSVSSPINDGTRVYVSYIQEHNLLGTPYSAIRAYYQNGDSAWPGVFWVPFDILVDPMPEHVSPSPAVGYHKIFHIVRAEIRDLFISGTIYELDKYNGYSSRQFELDPDTYFSLGSVALHYWDAHYRVFATQYNSGNEAVVELTDETG